MAGWESCEGALWFECLCVAAGELTWLFSRTPVRRSQRSACSKAGDNWVKHVKSDRKRELRERLLCSLVGFRLVLF